jgi:DNA-binding FadR family transcriptional regulator
VFRKATPLRTSSDIVAQIKQAILSGEFSPGSKLPSQRKLQTIFQVSRPVITESLRVLEKMGLIEIKPGSKGGTIVSNTTQERLSELFELIVQLEEISVSELVEFRLQMESLNAQLAAERREDKDIKKLRARINKMRQMIKEQREWSAIIEQDSFLHLEIAEVAKNKLSLIFLKLIWNDLLYVGLYHDLSEKVEEIYENLEELVDAIERRDPEASYTIMQTHIRRFNEDLLDSYNKTMISKKH